MVRDETGDEGLRTDDEEEWEALSLGWREVFVEE